MTGTRSLEDDHGGELQHLLRLAPARQGHRLVSPEDQEELVVGPALAQCAKSVDRVGRTLALELDPRRAEALVARDRELDHLETRLGARVLLHLAVRRLPHRDPHDRVQLEPRVRLLRREQVTQVRRVEDTAEDSDAH